MSNHHVLHLIYIFNFYFEKCYEKKENINNSVAVIVVQLIRCVQLFVTPQTVAHQAPLTSTVSQSLLKYMSIESVMPSKLLILCCPLSFCLQPFPASGSFPMSQLFSSGGQSIGASGSASVLSMNIQG